MRRVSWMFVLAVVALASFACSQESGSGIADNPVAPQTADLSAVSGAVQSQTNICHWAPDYIEEGEPYEYHVIGISTNGNAYNAHTNHGDPIGCDVSGFVVGDDCSSCVAEIAPAAVSAASKQAPVAICHFDVDLEEEYDSIVIEVNGNSLDAHLANHGDCTTLDAVGTENCACTI